MNHLQWKAMFKKKKAIDSLDVYLNQCLFKRMLLRRL